MNLAVRKLWLPKKGNSLEEYEDAFCLPPINRRALPRLAIADGATEASFSGLWARLLTKHYVKGLLRPTRFKKDLARIQKIWQKCVNNHENLAWYVAENLKIGAFSTILGISFSRAVRRSHGKWEAMAVGDSCLFQIRNNALIRSYPLAVSSQFGNNPELIPSNPIYNIRNNRKITCAGKWQVNDKFLLMTDAVAHWFMKQYEPTNIPLKKTQSIINCFRNYHILNQIKALRLNGELKNDDVTIIHIEIRKGN